MPRKKDRKPQVGETVYLKADVRCTPMYLDRIYTRDNVEYGFCFWTAYELVNDELVSEEKEQEFPMADLTVYADIKS